MSTGVMQQQSNKRGGGGGATPVAITYEGGDTDTVSASDRNLVMDISPYAAGDLAIVSAFSDGIITHTGPAGYTLIFDDDISTSGRRRRMSAWFKVLTASESNPIVGGSVVESRAVLLDVFGGCDTTTPFDVVYAQASHREIGIDNDLPTCRPIATASLGSGLVFLHGQTDGAVTAIGVPTSPSGIVAGQSSLGFHRNLFCAYLLDAGAAGTKTPSAWTHAGGATDGEYTVYTLALRAATA